MLSPKKFVNLSDFYYGWIIVAVALGAWMAGFIFDKTHSYNMAFILVIVVLLLSCVFVWLAAPRKFRGR